MTGSEDLGRLLRAWRDQAVVPEGRTARSRRAPGLRREELAQAADVSVDYVIRLEQGRSLRPSAPVVQALASALGLTREQSVMFHQAAGLAAPSRSVDRELAPDLARFVERVTGVAVAVYSADWWLLGWNRLWSDLLGDPSALEGFEMNLVWQVFTRHDWRPTPRTRSITQLRQALANDLRAQTLEYPDDARLEELITALTAKSDEFCEAWEVASAGHHGAELKNLRHPEAGNLVLQADTFQLREGDQHLVIYSAVPASSDAKALDTMQLTKAEPL